MTAFSNGSEFEVWAAYWCRKCARDEMGTAPEGTYCPILSDVIVMNEVPKQWTRGPDDLALHNRYLCSEFITGATPAYPEQWHAPLCFSQDGSVVHRVGCALAFGGRPWQWSTDQPRGTCVLIAGQAGWIACGFCEPFK